MEIIIYFSKFAPPVSSISVSDTVLYNSENWAFSLTTSLLPAPWYPMKHQVLPSLPPKYAIVDKQLFIFITEK